ncbi:MAG: UDP-N-acetylmuramoyl-tripeptide--D-alanyl-D-alanine ligase [Candidatus Margulisbacteria bacterium]|nr:UDP-N-acetylmuramoyl-tripeptide--D-alanyl-D-alanine ligase [Candidatus Margulisiibacteriota bacterium]
MFLKKELSTLFSSNALFNCPVTIKAISIDSRTIQPGELFIPIKGPKFDGRKFIPEILRKGAAVLKVKDGLSALHKIAAYHRSKFNLPIIGITGSVGKTTTKDMLAAILSQKALTLKNEENFNNEIGVPLTLLKLTKQHRFAVIEMAMQGLGEIDLLAKLVRPHIAIVTNIGESHLEFLKTKANIAKAKAEIFKYLTKNNYAVINQDDEYYENLMSNIKCQMSNVRTFGILEKANITPKDLAEITLPLPGEHIIYDALAAIAAAKILKFNKNQIKKGLETFKASSKRMDIFDHPKGFRIINDTYNANPQSMEAALKVLSIHQARKIAVLGNMFELGKSAIPAHHRIGKLARKLGIDVLVSVGKLAKQMRADHHFSSNQAAIKGLKKIVARGDAILVKGSRGMKMEEIVAGLTSC